MNMLRRIVGFYVEGFRSMTVGRSLWALILVKLAFMFLVMKLFFFPTSCSATIPTTTHAPTPCARPSSTAARHRQTNTTKHFTICKT